MESCYIVLWVHVIELQLTENPFGWQATHCICTWFGLKLYFHHLEISVIAVREAEQLHSTKVRKFILKRQWFRRWANHAEAGTRGITKTFKQHRFTKPPETEPYYIVVELWNNPPWKEINDYPKAGSSRRQLLCIESKSKIPLYFAKLCSWSDPLFSSFFGAEFFSPEGWLGLANAFPSNMLWDSRSTDSGTTTHSRFLSSKANNGTKHAREIHFFERTFTG